MVSSRPSNGIPLVPSCMACLIWDMPKPCLKGQDVVFDEPVKQCFVGKGLNDPWGLGSLYYTMGQIGLQ
jgi:hypothetical protein